MNEPDSIRTPGRSRGFLNGVDVHALGQRLHAPPYEKLWRHLEKRTLATLQRTEAEQFRSRHGQLRWFTRTPMMLEAALLALLNSDPAALRYIVACIDMIDRHQPTRHFDHLLHSYVQIAQAGDMLRDQLPEASIEAIHRIVRDKAATLVTADAHNPGVLGNNIAWATSVQVATCMLLWGRQAGVHQWDDYVQRGIRHTQGYLRFGMDADGHSYEGTGYGHSVLNVMFQFVELLKKTGHADLYTTEPRLRQALDATLHSLLPDGRFLTNDNDHGLIAVRSLACLLPAWHAWRLPEHLSLWHAYQGPDHAVRPFGDQEPWLAARLGHEITAPEHNASLFLACLYWDAEAKPAPLADLVPPRVQCARGVAKLNWRSSWTSDATFVQVLGSGRSHMSQTHRHADAGHFSIFARGEYLAIDPGRYNSDEDQHSVMLVDGQCHAPVAPGWGMDHHAGRFTHHTHQPPVCHVRVDMAHVKGCYWAQRDVLIIELDDDNAYIACVDDINKDNDIHAFWWQLQAHEQASFHIAHPFLTAPPGWQPASTPDAILQGSQAKLDMHFIAPAMTPNPGHSHLIALRQDEKEWQWPYGKSQKIDALHASGLFTSVKRPRFIAQLNGGQGRLLSIIHPGSLQTPTTRLQKFHSPDVMGCRIELDQWTDTLLASPSRGVIKTPQVSALSTLLWYRQDKQGRIVRHWTLEQDPAIHWL